VFQFATKSTLDVKLLFPSTEIKGRLALPIFFTPKYADEVLPEIRNTVQRVIAIKNKTDGLTNDDQMTDAMESLEKEVKKLEDLGCILKDMSIGLVDFPAVRLGERVWLCWKLGEEHVTFWHSRHEGYAARKPVVENEFYEDDLAIRSLNREVVSKAHS
jgi:hypothetical protein